MRLHDVFPAAFLAAACLGSAASAATTLSAGTILSGFNGVVYGQASTGADIEGAIVVGGTFSGATVYNNPTTTQPSGFGALTVFGSDSGNSINIDHGGDAYVAGAHGATINFNGGGGYIGAPDAAIASFETPLNALSTRLAGLSATGAMPATGNNELIKATPGAGGIAVFDVSSTSLDAIPSYQLDLNGAKTVIFNVSGSSVDFNANDESGVTGADDVIWNFYQANSVDLQTQIAGAVLAPLADVINHNQIDGVLVAKSWSGQGELHDYAFTGDLPGGPVPEPSVWAMLLVGFGALGAVLRRRRRPVLAA